MAESEFRTKLAKLIADHDRLIHQHNAVDGTWYNGLFERFRYPVLTAAHAPLTWRFDLDERSNPHLIERLGVNGAFNPGAMLWQGKVVLMVRVEGADRKSFFAVAESPDGINGFRFWDRPVVMPETALPDTNVYDTRLVPHEDGWIYGLFCTERADPKAAPGDLSSAVAQCGIARTKDLVSWQRLPDLRSRSPQQRNVVLHPELVGGKYAWYTRPQDDFIQAGRGGGIGWALSDGVDPAVLGEEEILDERVYHTIKEVKNGLGPAPIRTPAGWLHVAHGVRGTAAGLRYVLYAFLCDLDHPSRVIARPGGYLIAPVGPERIGDVSNVVFCNGMVALPDGQVLIYYASSDTRIHVARTSVDRMIDYVRGTPPDALRSAACVQQRMALIDKNLKLIESADDDLLKRAR
jgi:4-O-beta-D-mannosyl-D-glucose phosphorylase